MEYRELGRTGWQVSAVGFGAWGIGGDWGAVDDSVSLAALHTAIDQGVTLIDTADVYGDGRSERLVGRVLKDRKEEIIVATKAGRRLNPHTASGYNRENLTAFIERSLVNLDVETLDLVQLHCPPTDVYYMPDVFGVLDDLAQAGKIRHYGVSVEKVEEAIKAIEYPGVQTVQIIYNIFRQRPAEMFFRLAEQKQVGILARVPLSSGILAGKLSKDSTFEAEDHRHYNRHGEEFDKGETFSGVDYALSLEAVEALHPFVPHGWTMAQFALRWILMDEAVTCVIPGAKRPSQAADNAAAADLAPIPDEIMQEVRDLYERMIRDQVHHLW
jgi:aryl-alcohol dehydrogenase-like predicted oxidoreductase